jgi:NADH:ubiquinone reductase (H+-translocating)
MIVSSATGGALAPAEIAAPLRVILKRQPNVRVVMGEVRGFDLDARRVIVDPLPEDEEAMTFPYDTLIVAGGSRYSYFGHDEWRQFAHEIKSLESVVAVRQRIFAAFETAELEQDPERREAWLTFVVVGGGPTGVEMAGQIAELAHDTSPHSFRSADPRRARILLLEASDRLLPTFLPRLSAKAARALEKLGVTPLLHRRSSTSMSTRSTHGAPTARPSAYPRERSSGPPASSPPSSPARSQTPAASSSAAGDGSP